MIDIANVVYDSNYAIDKIVCLLTGQFKIGTGTTIPTAGYYLYAIPHNFTQPLFMELLWRINAPTFTDGGGSRDADHNLAIAYSDATNLYILVTNAFGTDLTGQTLTYKLIGSWIDNYSTTHFITPTINTTGAVYFDSRQNYEKVALQGVVTGTGQNGTIPIVHNLGYVPNAKTFFESNTGQVWPTIGGGAQDPWLIFNPSTQYECWETITSTTLTLEFAGGIGSVSMRAWYRIYYD